jgi:hypothetical protein
VPTRGPLGRFLLGLGLVCGGVLALAGGLALRGSGLVAVGVAGAVAAALAAGVARESPGAGNRAAVAAARQAAGWAVGALLVVSGLAAVAGGEVTALLTGAGVLAALAVVLRRRGRRRPAAPGVGSPAALNRSAPSSSSAWSVRPAGGPAQGLPPVGTLPTSALGREWLRTTTALAGRLQPATRESIVRRRQETLDELERRDPAGFARWMAGGPAAGSDPAQFVRGDVRDVRGDQAAGSDAA